MEVFLLKEGQRFGPYSPDEVKGHLDAGTFTESDLAFFEGCEGWVSITLVPGVRPEAENLDDPDVDYERQRELEEMFPDFEDDFTEEEEETSAEPESPPPVETAAEVPIVEPESPPAESSSTDSGEPAQTPSAEDVTPSSSSAEPSVAKSGGRGRRFSLSKAQAARRKRGGNQKGKQRPSIPFPKRPGVAAFGWLVFLSLVYGIGVSMMSGITSSTSKFVQISGNLHSLLVHLPVGALILAFPMHVLDRPGLFRHIGTGSIFVLWFAVLGSVLAVFTGYFNLSSGVSNIESLNLHVTTGILVGSGACGALFLKLLSRRFVEAWLHHLCTAFLLATVIALCLSVHTGASLTHGKDYLGIGTSSNQGDEQQAPALKKEEEPPPEEEPLPEEEEEP